MKHIALLSVILLCSCTREKEIIIDFPYEPKPVFYGFLGNEDGSMISAFESLPLTAQEPSYPLFNGQAYLHENDVQVDTFHIDENGVFRSNYRISESSDYKVIISNDNSSYESDMIFLPEENRIMSYNYSKIEDSRKAILELNFEQPFDSGDVINLYSSDSANTLINSSIQSPEDRKVVFVRFDYIYPRLGPSNEIIGYDTIDVLKVETKIFSDEKSRFLESRSQVPGIINAGSNLHNPQWTNIENAYGYISSYVSDSIFIDL